MKAAKNIRICRMIKYTFIRYHNVVSTRSSHFVNEMPQLSFFNLMSTKKPMHLNGMARLALGKFLYWEKANLHCSRDGQTDVGVAIFYIKAHAFFINDIILRKSMYEHISQIFFDCLYSYIKTAEQFLRIFFWPTLYSGKNVSSHI